MSDKSSFFAELKQRNVIRMAGLYLVGAWLLVQVASTVPPMFGARPIGCPAASSFYWRSVSCQPWCAVGSSS